jgi:hypothetical protein
MENVFHVFGTQSHPELLEFLGALSQKGLVHLYYVVVSVGGLYHRLTLAVEVQEYILISDLHITFMKLIGCLIMLYVL